VNTESNPSEPAVNPELQAATISSEPISSEPMPAAAVVPPAGSAPEAVVPKVIGYCRECGKALLEGPGVHTALGAIYCDIHRPDARTIEHTAPAPQQPQQSAQQQAAQHQSTWTASQTNAYTGSPYTATPYRGSQPLPPFSPLQTGTSPGLAFVLGLIPGVGAVYNGQYAKGLLHVVILGLAISLNNSGSFEFGPLFGLLVTCFWFYMAFDAYHTAKLRQAGMHVDEFSSVFAKPNAGPPRIPVGPIILIVVGVLFLLSNLEIIEIRRLMRYWPALLIVMGFYMLYVRLTESSTHGQPEVKQDDKRDAR
jgi:hypothetical protein